MKLKKQLNTNHIIQNITNRWKKIWDANPCFAVKHKETTDNKDCGIGHGDK